MKTDLVFQWAVIWSVWKNTGFWSSGLWGWHWQPSQQHCRYAPGELWGEHQDLLCHGWETCFQGAAFCAFCGSSKRMPYSYCSPNYWQGCMLGAKGVTCLKCLRNINLSLFTLQTFVGVVSVLRFLAEEIVVLWDMVQGNDRLERWDRLLMWRQGAALHGQLLCVSCVHMHWGAEQKHWPSVAAYQGTRFQILSEVILLTLKGLVENMKPKCHESVMVLLVEGLWDTADSWILSRSSGIRLGSSHPKQAAPGLWLSTTFDQVFAHTCRFRHFLKYATSLYSTAGRAELQWVLTPRNCLVPTE